MLLLLDATPRFLSVFLGSLITVKLLPLSTLPPLWYPTLVIFLLAVILLFIAGLLGLLAISSKPVSMHLQIIELIIEESIKLFIGFCTASFLKGNNSTVLTKPIAIVCLAIVSLFLLFSFTLGILSLFVASLPPTVTFVVSGLAALAPAALYLYTILRLYSSAQGSLVLWISLLSLQILPMAISCMHFLKSTVGLRFACRLCLQAWVFCTWLILTHTSERPSLQKKRLRSSTRRVPPPNVSEDFQSYRDPFVSPLTFSHSSTFHYPPSSQSNIAFSHFSGISDSIRGPKKSQSSHPLVHTIRSPASSRPGTAESDQGDLASFYTAEAYMNANKNESVDYCLLSDLPTSQVHSNQTWSIPLKISNPPVIPAPHLAMLPSPREAKVLRGSRVPMHYSSSTSLPSERPALVIPYSGTARNRTDSGEKTPTQSLYISTTSLVDALPDSASKSDNHVNSADCSAPKEAAVRNSSHLSHESTPSISSIPSIPSVFDMSENTSGSAFDSSGGILPDDSLLTAGSVKTPPLSPFRLSKSAFGVSPKVQAESNMLMASAP